MFQQPIFESFDKQQIGITTASKLVLIPIWNGNRTLDLDHVKAIENSIQSAEELNGTIFRIAVVRGDDNQDHRYILDGQHRATVIKNYFQKNPFHEDFNILIAEKQFESENQIVKFFKDMNRTRTIEWKEDPKMIANRFITVLLNEFQPKDKKGKVSLEYFRSSKTKSPYIHIDKVRDLMIERHIERWTKTPAEYATYVLEYNLNLLSKLYDKEHKTSLEERVIGMGFALAIDENYLWI